MGVQKSIMTNASPRKLSKAPFSIRVLAQVSLLVALEIVLSRFLSINTQVVKIGFAFVPVVICAAAYGPLWAGACAAVADIIGAILFPVGPFMPGITFTALLRGAALGFAYYGLEVKPKSPLFWIRHAGVVVFNAIVFSLLLNSYWLSIIYPRGFVYFVTSRILQEAIIIPVQIVINPLLMSFVWRLRASGLIESEYVGEEAVSWRKISAAVLLGCMLISLTVAFTGLMLYRKISDTADKTAVLADFLTEAEAADYLKMTAEKLSELIAEGELDGTFGEINGKRIFDREALRNWIAGRIAAKAVD